MLMNRNTFTTVTYFLLRVVSAFLILHAGAAILFGWFDASHYSGIPSLKTQVGIGGVLEFFGGLAVLVGIFTRPISFILSGMMAVAYWQFHAPHGRWPIQNQGMPAILLCFIFLLVAAEGAGPWSLDALIFRSRRT